MHDPTHGTSITISANGPHLVAGDVPLSTQSIVSGANGDSVGTQPSRALGREPATRMSRRRVDGEGVPGRHDVDALHVVGLRPQRAIELTNERLHLVSTKVVRDVDPTQTAPATNTTTDASSAQK